MNFDEKMKQLQSICDKIQNENCSVSDSVNMYEEASKIALECMKYLDETRGRITVIKKQLDNYCEENFDID